MSFILFISLLASTSSASSLIKGIRVVESTSCEVIPVNLGLGMSTQIILEQEPKATLYADKKHFKIDTNKLSPRSLAIIPAFTSQDLDVFKDSQGNFPSSSQLAKNINDNFKTNLFVYFKNNNQLMFQLRFVEKQKADYILKVKQVFNKGCNL